MQAYLKSEQVSDQRDSACADANDVCTAAYKVSQKLGFLGSTRNAFLRPVSIYVAAPASLDS